MQQIINFLIRNKNFLLFLLLLFLSLILTIQSHSYHKSKFISSTNFLTGGVYGWRYSINNYFGLKSENERLLEENEQLRNQISWLTADTIATKFIDTTSFNKPFTFIKGNVFRNDYSKTDNYILINKGEKDGIEEDMGVITDKGIIGIVENTSKNYSRVLSILNSNSKINAGLKNSNQYGSLVWNGKDPNIVQLETVPRQAILQKGDTIITNGRSTIFPRGIGIGTILNYKLDQNQSYFLIDVQLFNDMTDIGFLYAIKSNDVLEIKSLENPKIDE
ncbi:rod shape-determining protein MreC [Aquimarina sp. BL5]|uniref:rod shape-determining protein MreC n=1 Tax=Aquimarina sp. BL5 TaxID=1714860 RepID=UPI000E4A62DD|nr:rod shape-determining protein MreC [Aquimarina sp. BL5]AXT51512.1 rod shape-determining protein MreC [Aquimarina sp. BL5]RKN06919.1 rod shape-determining protein MreC [Aquimarina sp. BL5]